MSENEIYLKRQRSLQYCEEKKQIVHSWLNRFILYGCKNIVQEFIFCKEKNTLFLFEQECLPRLSLTKKKRKKRKDHFFIL